MSGNNESLFLRNIDRGLENNLLVISSDNSKITYNCKREFTTKFNNTEEKIRASYFTELILDYQYPAKNIDMEVIVPRRTPEDKADIVVYEDDETKKPYLVIECKKDGITDNEFKQAIEQAFGNANSLRAKFASVVAGITRTAFDVAGFKSQERDKNVIADIPKKFGIAPKYKFVKGNIKKDLKIVSREELIRTLEKSHDTVWEGGRRAPTVAFDEVSKLLFCKISDERERKKGDTYKFQIGTHESAKDVSDRISEIYQEAKMSDPEVFRENISLEPSIVYNVVEHLQELNLTKIDLDTKGVAFELFMQDFFKGKMGQFFTPRPIVQFCVNMLNPQKKDSVLDPACGSGGFLLNSLDKVREFAEKNYDENEAWQHWHNFALNNLFGIEINDQIARVCKMDMIIHDDGHTNIISTDALRTSDDLTESHEKFKNNHFDIVITNPPFGATIKSTEKTYLEDYTFGKDKKNQKTEILFIERCLNFVKYGGGRIGIVLPDGILTNTSLQYVRDFIMQHCEILAIVSIPSFAFTHFGAGVKSSLVFLRKKKKNEILTKYPIFMAIADHIGYDATGRESPINDLDKIYKKYTAFRIKHPIKLDSKSEFEGD